MTRLLKILEGRIPGDPMVHTYHLLRTVNCKHEKLGNYYYYCSIGIISRDTYFYFLSLLRIFIKFISNIIWILCLIFLSSILQLFMDCIFTFLVTFWCWFLLFFFLLLLSHCIATSNFLYDCSRNFFSSHFSS